MSKLNIYQRINAVMAEIKTIGKDAFVQTGGYDKRTGKENGYKAVTHDHVTSKLHPIVQKNGIVILPTIKDHAIESFETVKTYNGQTSTKQTYQVTLTAVVRFQNIDDKEDFWECSIPSYAFDTQDKAVGKAVSMAVKYALLKTFMLESGDEEESREVEPPKKSEVRKKLEQTMLDLIQEVRGTIPTKKTKDFIAAMPDKKIESSIVELKQELKEIKKQPADEDQVQAKPKDARSSTFTLE